MRIRIRIQQLKLMRIHADPDLDPDPDPKPCEKTCADPYHFNADLDPAFSFNADRIQLSILMRIRNRIRIQLLL
jgi:hypothetical protein